MLCCFRSSFLPGAVQQPTACFRIHRAVPALRDARLFQAERLQATATQLFVDHAGIKFELMRTDAPTPRASLRYIAHKFFQNISKRTTFFEGNLLSDVVVSGCFF